MRNSRDRYAVYALDGHFERWVTLPDPPPLTLRIPAKTDEPVSTNTRVTARVFSLHPHPRHGWAYREEAE